MPNRYTRNLKPDLVSDASLTEQADTLFEEMAGSARRRMPESNGWTVIESREADSLNYEYCYGDFKGSISLRHGFAIGMFCWSSNVNFGVKGFWFGSQVEFPRLWPMKLNQTELGALADVATKAALEAGALIMHYGESGFTVSHKEGGDSLASQVVTEVDERAQAVILERLGGAIAHYDLALLTEEMEDDGSRFEQDYFLCIDPLDGTLPFTQGKPGYAVSIALVRQDGESMIGVVYDPVDERLFRAVSGQGLTINGQDWEAPLQKQRKEASLRFCMDCTFETDPRRGELTARMTALAQRAGYTGATIEINGGAVCNACYVLEHAPAVYSKEPKPELGGGSFWDFAATACIFQEAGASVSDYFGQTLELNSSTHTFFNHCGVCFCSDAELAKVLRAAL